MVWEKMMDTEKIQISGGKKGKKSLHTLSSFQGDVRRKEEGTFHGKEDSIPNIYIFTLLKLRDRKILAGSIFPTA